MATESETMVKDASDPLRVEGSFQRHADMVAKALGGEVRVGTRQDSARKKDGHSWTPYKVGDRATHHLRVVATNEIVFDIGDDKRDEEGNRTPTPWPRIVDETYALWIALNRMGIPYWGALSGGKGTHTHVFGPPGSNPAAEVERRSMERAIVAEDPDFDQKAVIASAPPCVQRVFRGLANGIDVPHAGRFLIAAYMHQAGASAKLVQELFVRTPNYNRGRTVDSVASIYGGHYLPPGCAKLQAEGICRESMKTGRCHRVSNPASWLLKPKAVDETVVEAEQPQVDEGPQDWRNAASGSILEVANGVLSKITGIPFDAIDADHHCLTPSKDGRLVREFGRRKSPAAKTRKVMWTSGPGPFRPLPGDTPSAYEQAEATHRIYPTSVPIHPSLPGFDRSAEAKVAGVKCPTGPSCVPHGLSWTGINPRGCEQCPLFQRQKVNL
jgi:hypothetical protein